MKLNKFFQSLLLTSTIVYFISTPAKSEEIGKDGINKTSTQRLRKSRFGSKVRDRNSEYPVLTSNYRKPQKRQLITTYLQNYTRLGRTDKNVLQLSEIELPATNAQMLVQTSTPSNTNPSNSETPSQLDKKNKVVPITGVKAKPTDKGVEVILQTTQGKQLQAINRSSGNQFIADIPNAQLRLPSGDTFKFSSEKPREGITEITVINLDANTVRITATGETALPKVEFFDSNEGLIFGFALAANTAQKPDVQKPDTETKPNEQKSENEEPIELTVTGQQDGYFIPEATTGTKIDTLLRDVPASIQVIPKEVIEDRQVIKLNELADNVSGVQEQGTYGGINSQGYFIRGFSSEFEALRNGFRDFGFTTPRDVANIDRVEFLKGPASILYGSVVSPGGVVNTITKKPLPDPFYQINGTIGNYDFYRGTIDLTGPVTQDRSFLYRLNAAYENADSFRDFVDNESTFVAPSVTLNVGEKTKITFDYEYQKYNYVFDRGFPADNVIFDVPISRFVGEPNLNDAEYKSNGFTYTLESNFGENDNWKFRQGFNILNVTGSDRGVQPQGIDEDGRTVQRRFRASDSEQKNISFQNEITGKFNIGSIKHNILLGFEITSYSFTSDFFRGEIAELDIFNPVYGAQPENVRRTSSNRYGADSTALYFQNLIEVTSNIKFLAGGRFDWVDTFNEDLESNTTLNESSNSKFSPRLGIVYQPSDSTSLYGSWTNSFNPQIFSRTRNDEPFEPETAEQFEVGIKQEFFDKRLSATLAYFDITKKNVATTDPVDPDFSIQTGEQKSRGVNLDIIGEILPGWKVIGTYAYTDAFISEDNDPELVNNRLVGVPYNSASLWTTYELQRGSLQGLGLGLGLVYAGEREAALPNDVKIPSYVRTDASISYKRNNLRAALNFKNLFDKKYYNSQGFFIVPAAPFTVLGSISVEF